MLKRETRLKWAEKNPCVMGWLQRLGEGTRRRAVYYAQEYFTWLWENGGEFAHKSLEELLDLQDKATGRDRYKQLDMLQRYVASKPGAFNSKKNVYTAIRSFYEHNRVPLPRDLSFRVRADWETTNGQLDVEKLRKIVLASNLRYKTIFLCMFQSAMGEGEFEYFNQSWEDQVKPQLEEGRKRLKIHLPGRKHAKNERPYYTFIGRDGVNALKEYLAKERGIIRPREAIFLNDKLNPVMGGNIRIYFNRVAEKAGLLKKPYPPCPKCGGETISKRRRPGPRGYRPPGKVYYFCTNPKCGAEIPASKEFHLSRGVRYGLNPHEMRDIFRSEWELSRAKSVCAEFFMGHDIDPNMYNKIMKLHPDWAENQYAQAEPYLNILSEEPRKVSVDDVHELKAKIAELEGLVATYKAKVNGFEDRESHIQKMVERMERMYRQTLEAQLKSENPELRADAQARLKELEEEKES